MTEKEKTEKEILQEINSKLDTLILVNSIMGKEEKEVIKFLKNYVKDSNLSKREIEKITGVDRHRF